MKWILYRLQQVLLLAGGALKCVIKTLEKIRKLAHANEEIDALIRDLEDVQALLQATSELVTNGDFGPSQKQFLTRQVLRLGERIEELNRALHPPRPRIPGIGEERQLHISWVTHESKIKSLRSGLSRCEVQCDQCFDSHKYVNSPKNQHITPGVILIVIYIINDRYWEIDHDIARPYKPAPSGTAISDRENQFY